MPPLTFEPILKRIRWGGRRLGTVLGKPIGDASDYAESWEVVDHGDDQSVVDDGPLAGRTLSELVREDGDRLFGRSLETLRRPDQFPLLIKFLDASDRLSVQVHPDDELARRYDAAENGKTEAWVILDAEPGAVLYAGLRPSVDAASLRRAVEEDRVEEVLHTIPVTAGQCIFIPAGTVHAIGEGVLLAEVQQSSDLTFRLSDWGRVGADGKPRQLHLEESIEATDFSRGPVDPVTPRPVDGGELLCECPFFAIRRRSLPTGASWDVPQGECRILIGVEGSGSVSAEGHTFDASRGRTVVCPGVPDGPVTAVASEDWTLLDVTCGPTTPS